MPDANLSAVLLKKGDLKLEDRPVPVPKHNEVLIAVHSVGICGSDVHYLTEGRIGDFIVKSPIVLGHEASGVVVGIGTSVNNLAIGDRIAMEPGVPCRACSHCKIGRYNLCADITFFATPPYDGSLCRYIIHPADFCFKLPEHVTMDEGAMLEPMSVGVHACRRAEIRLGQTVLICGAGPIGLVNLLIAKAMGASVIIITDLCENRLLTATKMGADHAVKVEARTKPQEVVDRILKALDGASPDVTIECSGAEHSIQTGILATKSGGVMVMVGLGPPLVSVPLVSAAVREVDIRGVFRYANTYPSALAMIASGSVNVKPMITHHFTLEQSAEAFETARTTSAGAIKIVIHCNRTA